MGLVIDTSILITLERRRQALSTFFAAVPDEPLTIAAITVSELLVGVHLADSPSRRLRRDAYVEEVLSHFQPLDFGLREAQIYAQQWAHLRTTGQPIGAHDLLIAATALSHDYAVLTDNVRDFDSVPGLQVRRPDW